MSQAAQRWACTSFAPGTISARSSATCTFRMRVLQRRILESTRSNSGWASAHSARRSSGEYFALIKRDENVCNLCGHHCGTRCGYGPSCAAHRRESAFLGNARPRVHFELAGRQAPQPPRTSRQVGGALFLSQGFHQRLHRGSPEFPARSCSIRTEKCRHPRRQRPGRKLTPKVLRERRTALQTPGGHELSSILSLRFASESRRRQTFRPPHVSHRSRRHRPQKLSQRQRREAQRRSSQRFGTTPAARKSRQELSDAFPHGSSSPSASADGVASGNLLGSIAASPDFFNSTLSPGMSCSRILVQRPVRSCKAACSSL